MRDLRITLLMVVIFLATPLVINYWSNYAHQIKQNLNPKPLKTTKNKSVTLEEFKDRYDANVLKNEVSDLLFSRVETGNTVKMTIETENREGNITKIMVTAQPFKNANRDEKTKTLLLQSTVFSLAAMVFNPEMENQSYREKVIRLLYENIDQKDVTSGNLKCKAIKEGDRVILTIMPI